jgi:hypothetical protein|tara:strand:- start:31395 stop:31853 length:459 start_codon:yes stop_codon:yes gene_type:complete
MDNSKLYILTFVITALWDVVLRFLSEGYESLPEFMKYDFIRYLKPYFEKHTLLAAALIAGFIGATCQMIIVNIMDFPRDLKNHTNIIHFMILSFIISALYGFIMKFSKLFPHIEDTYYKNLGTVRSMYHDGISGIMVQFTILFLILIHRTII